MLDISEETQQYGIPAGAAVQSVVEDSPAQQAGLQRGDVITSVNCTQMNSNELVDYVGSSSVGDVIKLTIYRQGETIEITVTVGEQIQSALEQADTKQQSNQGNYPWGSNGRH